MRKGSSYHIKRTADGRAQSVTAGWGGDELQPPSGPTKVCPHCSAIAQTFSKKCPHCGKRYKKHTVRNVLLGLIAFSVLAIGLAPAPGAAPGVPGRGGPPTPGAGPAAGGAAPAGAGAGFGATG